MSSFHVFFLKALGLPLLIGAASLSEVKTRSTQRASKPSVSVVSDVDDFDYGMALESFKKKEPAAVYDHMPKAGGTFLIRLLKAAVGQQYFTYEGEFKNLTRNDIHHKFVIGSVRNPCDYYISLWAYGAERGGAMMSHVPKDQKWVYNTDSEFKDSDSDVHRFHKWITAINRKGYPGVMSVRFAQSYAKMDTVVRASAPPVSLEPRELDAVGRALSTPAFMKRVDCFIKVDDILHESADCLHKWRQTTGLKVDWDAYKRAAKEGNQLKSKHSICRKYYTPELEKVVRDLEAPIFKFFKYDSCCA